MSRKTNESKEKEKAKKVTTTAKRSSKTATTKNAKSTTKTTTAKKSAVSETAKNAKVSKKNTNTTSSKKVSTAKKVTKTAAAKKTSTSKSTAKKIPGKSNKKTIKKKANPEILEYYDLPYRYNQTIVKILAQTPNTLFVYWDVSDEDKEKYINEYGKDFFEKTVPVLIIHNQTQNYSFEIEVNDFANSWYFNVNDANCLYEIEFGRKLRHINDISIPNNYIQIVSSNKIEAPNDHILFEKEQKNVFFRNIKTNNSYEKNIAKLDFMEKIGTIYNIYEVYKKIYKNENLDEIKNPSSY